MSNPGDRYNWPVEVYLVCSECATTHTIRTRSVEAAKRTSERAGWTYDEWPANKYKPETCWCPNCSVVLPEDDQ